MTRKEFNLALQKDWEDVPGFTKIQLWEYALSELDQHPPLKKEHEPVDPGRSEKEKGSSDELEPGRKI